jgi:hypothetical protein
MTPREFVAALRARGVTLTLKGNRLHLYPWDSYRRLSPDELMTLKEHRAEIKAVVRDAPTAHEDDASNTIGTRPVQEAGSESAPPIDLDARLKEHNPDAWRAIHANDPEEIKRRTREATAVMLKTMRFYSEEIP